MVCDLDSLELAVLHVVVDEDPHRSHGGRVRHLQQGTARLSLEKLKFEGSGGVRDAGYAVVGNKTAQDKVTEKISRGFLPLHCLYQTTLLRPLINTLRYFRKWRRFC
jgi:hypothetical protein